MSSRDGEASFDNASHTFNHSPPEYTQMFDATALSNAIGQFGGKIYRRENEFRHELFGESRAFIEITYLTRNKDGKKRICAKSLFEKRRAGGEPYHWAYMFTTNDPLNCDNFNKSSTVGKCVEQSVFCEAKAKLALNLLPTVPEEDVWQLVTTKSRFVPASCLVGLLSDNSDFEDPLYDDIKDNKDALIDEIKERLNPENMMSRYTEFLGMCLRKPVWLSPLEHYKNAGRSVLAVGRFIQEWDKLAFPCVVTERNLLQRKNQLETELLVGMRARCVIECSADDNIWGFKHEQKELKMAYFDQTDGRHFMFKMIETVVRQQDHFIASLRTDDRDAITQLLTSPSLKHKLGLSIRLLQALYSGELQLHPLVHLDLRAHMRGHGLEWNVDLPDGLQSHAAKGSIYDLASSVGTPI
jgi:hypothetical protein